MICYVKDYKDGWLTMKLQLWDSNKLIYETPVEKIEQTNESAEQLTKMKCFFNLYRKKLAEVETAKEIINLIPTYDMEN